MLNNLFFISGTSLFLVGTLLTIFRKPFSDCFCKMSKNSLSNSKHFNTKTVNTMYNEKTMPQKVFYVGVSIIGFSIITIILGFVVKSV